MISKQPTIDDIYNFDAYISTPGVREGLMQRATLDDPEFTLEDTDDGQAMYFNTPHGEQVFVGMPEQTMPGRQEGDVMLAAGPSGTVSDSAPPIRVGRAGVPFKGPSMSDITEPAKAMADMFAGAFKGAVQGFTGTPGELEGFIYGLKELATRNADTSMLDAFVKGYEQKTILPKTEEVKAWLDKNVGVATSYKNPYEGIGETVAPGGQIKAGQAVVKGAVSAAKAMAPEAGQLVAKSMDALGTPLQMNIVETSPTLQKIEGGIKFPTDDSANRLRLKAQREKQALEGKAMPGMPKNERTVIEAPEGSEMPNFVVGKITPEDWIQRTEAILSSEEILQYAKWYEDVRGTFLKYTDGDEAKTDKYMRAWLVANQNIGVDGAFNNVLLQAEQFARQVPAGEMKAAGLPLATKAARSTLQDEPITEGVGLKISDFVDSAEGKSVRSIYGNDPLAGQPFVVDIHTARDTGLVDEILLNHLERQGYKVDRDRITTDLAGGPTDTQYENRADFGRNLTAELNSINWQGRSDWQPKEVQAVGWMAMTRLTADAADDTVTALERSLRRISMEAAPGEGSPWATKYGAAFNALSGERQAKLTQAVTERAMQMAKEISGIDLRSIVHGTGGWENYQNPAAIAQTLATRSGAEIAANVVGYLTQQTEVWVNSIKGTTRNPKALAIDFIESGSDNLSTNEGLQNFWAKIREADSSGLFVGYQPIRTVDGEVGIRVIVDKGGEKRMNDVQSAIQGSLSQALKMLDFKVQAYGYEADLVKARNDWKEFSDGRAYLERLANLGVKRTAADLDPLRGELEKIFERELAAAAPPSGSGTAGGTAGNKAKAKIKRGGAAPTSGAK